jgi:hypothetical protein
LHIRQNIVVIATTSSPHVEYKWALGKEHEENNVMMGQKKRK